jgi:hypothetical protein
MEKKTVKQIFNEALQTAKPREKKIYIQQYAITKTCSIATTLKGLNMEQAVLEICRIYQSAAEGLGVPVESVIMEKETSGYTTSFSSSRLETVEEFHQRLRNEAVSTVENRKYEESLQKSKEKSIQKRIALLEEELKSLKKS